MLWYRGGLVFETLVSLSLRFKDLVGPVTRVKKKKRRCGEWQDASSLLPLSRELGTFKIWTWLLVQVFETAELFPARSAAAVRSRLEMSGTG